MRNVITHALKTDRWADPSLGTAVWVWCYPIVFVLINVVMAALVALISRVFDFSVTPSVVDPPIIVFTLLASGMVFILWLDKSRWFRRRAIFLPFVWIFIWTTFVGTPSALYRYMDIGCKPDLQNVSPPTMAVPQ